MNIDALLVELRCDEGVVLRPYTDTTGHTTIGVGHNLSAKGISPAVCDLMLTEDVRDVVADLNRYLPWWTQLSDVRQRVLANMCFNLGITGLVSFRNTLSCIQSGAYDAAAAGMMESLWAQQVGPRAQRLAAMMRTGLPPPGDVA